jgi:hypothetical protein
MGRVISHGIRAGITTIRAGITTIRAGITTSITTE